MDRAFGFFRVFDVAFFVPGLIIVASVTFTFGLWEKIGQNPPSTVTEVAIGLVLLVCCFVVGIITHGIGQLIKLAIDKLPCSPKQDITGDEWYTHISNGKRDDLAIYFWYTRSTCMNCGVAVLISGVLLLYCSEKFIKLIGIVDRSGSWFLISFFWILSVVILFCLSIKYKDSRDKYASASSSSPPETQVEEQAD